MGKQFVRGDPRINRKGRPKKGQSMTEILSYKLDQKNDAGLLRREAIAGKLISMAENGDLPAIRYICDRLDGRPRETVSVSDSSIDTKLRILLYDQQ